MNHTLAIITKRLFAVASLHFNVFFLLPSLSIFVDQRCTGLYLSWTFATLKVGLFTSRPHGGTKPH